MAMLDKELGQLKSQAEGLTEGTTEYKENLERQGQIELMQTKIKALYFQATEVPATLSSSATQLAVAWVLQNPNVSSAIVGATRPEQVRENVKAAGVKLDAGVLERIDEILTPFVIRDPARTGSPLKRT